MRVIKRGTAMRQRASAAALVIVAWLGGGTAVAQMGGVVTDPTSYTYYVEQLRQMEQTYEQMVRQAEGLERLHTNIQHGDIQSVDQVRNAMEGMYNHTEGTAALLQASASRIQGVDAPLQRSDESGMEWVGEEYLTHLFRNPGEAGQSFENAAHAEAARQYTYEQALLASRSSMEGVNERLNTQRDLAERIDRTENIKDATDLSNRMLLELLGIQTEMLAALNYMGAAIAIQEYSGQTEPVTRGSGGTPGGGAAGGAGSGGMEEYYRKHGRGGDRNWSDLAEPEPW